MLRIFPEQADDLLDIEALPPTDKTELNYRTRPLTAEQERRLTLLVLLGTAPVGLILGVSMSVLTTASSWIDEFVFAAGPVLITWLFIRRMMGAIVRWEILATLLFFLCSMGGLLWQWAVRGEHWTWGLVIVATWTGCALIARQVAAWILVGPTVDHERMERWKVNLPSVVPDNLSLDCPELLTYAVSPILLGCAGFLSVWLLHEQPMGVWLWPLTVPLIVVAVWFGWHLVASPLLPWPSFTRSWQLTWQALVVFVTYDPYHTPAAGVFRFPTPWLRNPWHRWISLGMVLVGIAFAYAVACPHPADMLAEQGMFLGPLTANLLLATVTAPVVFVCTLWLTAGTLLARFDQELSHLKDDETTVWDNYVDRIINSEDELEREHMLLGTSEQGDYPILVHREIHDQHAHILGDSGASKTALGIAPQVTQKIARGDSTVVVVDLKGDRALFETCRREAERTGKLRFRWLSNEVGKTTFSFNPFLQSHNHRLSVEQLTQQLLQGLSLDYGIQYGAGYFTAMNEIVLNNVLQETGAKSFRELSAHLSDRRWYASIGHEDDWKQARHLSALVKRLAGSAAVNVVPGMYSDQPEVHQQAIDMSNLFEQPQVVYLWLRSAVEPTNAPAIARLFLWAMFTAASHQPQDENRVYFFVDEMQQIISDGIKLIFEQFRDLGGTIVAAHQTAGQLRRQGTDLGDTIDSCTAMKQVFRASDLHSMERLEKLSGTRTNKTPTWYQPYERGTGQLTERYDPLLAEEGIVRITEEERARYDRNELLAISSRRQSSLVRFTFGEGYTQFGGATIPMVSQFAISFDQYLKRRREPWPTAAGAFRIDPSRQYQPKSSEESKRTRRPGERKPESRSERHERVKRSFLKRAKKHKSQR